jgi:hypothetical protein
MVLDYWSRTRRVASRRDVLFAAGVVIAVVVLAAARAMRPVPPPPTYAPPAASGAAAGAHASAPAAAPELSAVRRQAWEKIQPRLDAADVAAYESALVRGGEIKAFFALRRAGAAGFAEAVLSMKSKWLLATDKLRSRRDHRAFLDATFAAYLFKPQDLQAVLDQAIGDYARDLQAHENALLISIRADLIDLPAARTALPALRDARQFRHAYERMAARVHDVAARDARVEGALLGGSIVAPIILQRVTVAVATRLGVSAGILGAGAASSAYTLGAGLVVGVVVDVIAHRIMDRYLDPRGTVERRVVRTLEETATLLVDGDPNLTGSYASLRQLEHQSTSAANRAAARADADAIERSGSLGLRHEFHRVAAERRRARDAGLRAVILQEG